MNDQLLQKIERFLLFACGALLLFFYLYVYVGGKVRGPLAREEYYRLGDISDDRVKERYQEEENSKEDSLMSEFLSADE